MTDSDYKTTAAEVRLAAAALRNKIAAARNAGLEVHIGEDIKVWMEGYSLHSVNDMIKFTRSY